MRILDLAFKNISQIFRDKMAFLFLLVMPLVFTFFMGFVFGAGAAEEDTRLPVGWLNQDAGGLMSAHLERMLADSEVVRLEPVESLESANEQARNGELAGAVIVPAGFSQTTLSGGSARITLIADESSSNAQAVRETVRPLVVRLLSAGKISRLSIANQSPNGQAAALDAAVQAWSSPKLDIEVMPVYAAGSETEERANPYNQMSPGMLVQFVLFGLVTSGMLLVNERKDRTLQRMLTTSMNRAGIIAGHVLSMFFITLMQQVILVAFGQFLLGVDYLRQPLAILLLITVLALFISALGLLIGVMAKREEQVILFSLICMFVLTALAGAWFPLDVTGPAFNTIGHLTPGAWAMNGFQNIVIRGMGFNSVLLPAAVVLGYAALVFAVALWRFREE
ncbi:MAG TPA: ABC transporter permease [Levilinea sp.]|nr:ABC transporter permease [Levilinea sp.]